MWYAMVSHFQRRSLVTVAFSIAVTFFGLKYPDHPGIHLDTITAGETASQLPPLMKRHEGEEEDPRAKVRGKEKEEAGGPK